MILRNEDGRTTLRRRMAAAAQGVIWVDRFTRTAYFGFTGMLVMIGAGTATGDPGSLPILALFAVAVCFHVYSYVLNDVIDLDVDATQPRRADDPLVRGLRGEGGLSRRTGLAIALLPLPLAAGITVALGGNRSAWIALAASFLLIGVYNVWGKRCPVPPLTDFLQSCGWASLALYATWIASPNAGWSEIADRLLPLLALSIGLIVLITGIHGGLRDLVNDRNQGRINASIFLGAKPLRPGDKRSKAAQSSVTVVAYSFAWLLFMFLPSFTFLDPARGHYATPAWHAFAWIAVTALFGANAYLLWKVSKPSQPDRDPWVSRQVVVLWIPAFAVYLPSALLSARMKWVVLAVLVLPPLFQVKTGRWALDRLGRQPAVSAAEPTGHASPRSSG